MGIKVVLFDIRIESEKVFSQVEAALTALQRFDKRRYTDLCSRVRYLAVAPGNYSNVEHFRGIALSSTMLANRSSVEAAGVIVHELTHVRIEDFGIPYTKDRRDRIERLCTAQEATFLRRDPENGDAMAEDVLSLLETRWWEEGPIREDARRTVRELPAPAWLKRFIENRLREKPPATP